MIDNSNIFSTRDTPFYNKASVNSQYGWRDTPNAARPIPETIKNVYLTAIGNPEQFVNGIFVMIN